MFGLEWLVDHGALPKERARGILRIVRGRNFPHGSLRQRPKRTASAEMMEFNYLCEHGAIKREASGKYAVDYVLMPSAIADLAKELLEIEATGDRQRAENWFKKYDVMSPELTAALNAASKVPVDVDPVFAFKETVR